jgi:hypothetical protein
MIAAFADLEIPDVRKISSVQANTGMELFEIVREETALCELGYETLHLR